MVKAVDGVEAVRDVLGATRTESGRTLLAVVEESPVLLVFLRHFGCSFCRETIARVGQVAPELHGRGVRPVFVHLGTPAIAQAHFAHYGMESVERVHEPEARLYQQAVFGLGRTNPLLHMFRPNVLGAWMGGIGLRRGIGWIQGDGHQMPGVFFLRGPQIVRRFVHRSIADQPDYLALVV